MCSKDLGADMVFAWPTAEIAVMGPRRAASIIFKRRSTPPPIPPPPAKEKLDAYRAEFATPYQAAKRGYVDDVIEPCETRRRGGRRPNMLASKRVSNPHKARNFPV